MAETQTSPKANTANASTAAKATSAPGLRFTRKFSKAGVSPYDEVQWERRTAAINDMSGKIIFEQKDVEVPVDWSMTATNIVASKYLHGQTGTPERESGVRALVGRVADTIAAWGRKGGYFASDEDASAFHDDLTHLLVQQKVAFNSPVWFNVGCDKLEPNSDAQNWHWDPKTREVTFSQTGYRNPQCSACFINSVDDSLDSILTLAKTEGMLFKWGSGTGTNLSTAKPRRKPRPTPSSLPATMAPAPTPRPSPPSSSRTPTTLSASTTSSCTHGSRTPNSPPAPSRTAHPPRPTRLAT
jgi:ribonucleoside-diphosphate reductase alpha chain